MINIHIDGPPADPALIQLLRDIAPYVVIIGSTARRKPQPKDLDLLWNLDSDVAREKIKAAIERSKLKFVSVFPGSWSFLDYGPMIEILSLHKGSDYRTCRRKAEDAQFLGVIFKIAAPEHA